MAGALVSGSSDPSLTPGLGTFCCALREEFNARGSPEMD